MTVITVISDLVRGSAAFLRGWRQFGIEPIVLGLNHPYRGHVWRQRLALDVVKKLSGLVLMADGYDTVPVRHPAKLIKGFREFNAPLVVSAELGCYPDVRLAPFYPPCKTPYRYLNSGALDR